MNYSDKLKDPRWQKKRLEILTRDEWTCQYCEDKQTTLHVHHTAYVKGKDPWDIPNGFLVTLCENCHDAEEYMKSIAKDKLPMADLGITHIHMKDMLMFIRFTLETDPTGNPRKALRNILQGMVPDERQREFTEWFMGKKLLGNG